VLTGQRIGTADRLIDGRPSGVEMAVAMRNASRIAWSGSGTPSGARERATVRWVGAGARIHERWILLALRF